MLKNEAKMKPKYNVDWLLERHNHGENINYLFFWGHSHAPGEAVGKSCLSQWFEAAFAVDGKTYKTAEHWMMAQKALLFEDAKAFEKIIRATTPKEAKALGRKVVNFDEERWNTHRFALVKTGNVHKFKQHPLLLDYLLDTGDKVLVEASPVDAIWGIGMSQENKNVSNPHHWRGLNLLGFALMEVRDFLRG